ncbi:RCC1-like domain-containing protein [Undibacter mobilis]|uniref:RCC1-like domain-containing protein n=1 Tax=Undibacter mobilis TaxID=2292256 RepID=UPI003D311E45
MTGRRMRRPLRYARIRLCCLHLPQRHKTLNNSSVTKACCGGHHCFISPPFGRHG